MTTDHHVTHKIYPFIAWRKKAYCFSIGLFLVLLIGTIARGGLSYGIDFVGGTSVIVKFDHKMESKDIADLRGILEPYGLGGNIRTMAEMGASKEEQRSVAIEVRGSSWVDEMTQQFLTARDQAKAAGKPFTVADVRSAFEKKLEPESLNAVLDNFTAVGTDTHAVAMYGPESISSSDLKDVFQAVFNENTSLQVQSALMKAMPPAGGAKAIDLNNVGNAQSLADALAEVKVAALAEKIGADSGARAWRSVEEFLAAHQLQPFDNPMIRQNLFSDSSPRPEAVSVLTGEPRALAGVFHAAFAARFLPTAQIVTTHRDRDLGGIFTSVEQAVKTVPESDLESRQLIEKNACVGRFIIAQSETVGPSASADLIKNTYWAVFWSLMGIVVYVWARFELRYGVGAFFATLHDPVMMIGFCGFFGIEFNIQIVAAILTVIGYSINDTIVVYDRIREKLGKLRTAPDPGLIDLAITETLTRTIFTGSTTLLCTLAFVFFGPSVTKDMCLLLTAGIVVGTYSSIFVAAPILVEWDHWVEHRNLKSMTVDAKKK